MNYFTTYLKKLGEEDFLNRKLFFEDLKRNLFQEIFNEKIA